MLRVTGYQVSQALLDLSGNLTVLPVGAQDSDQMSALSPSHSLFGEVGCQGEGRWQWWGRGAAICRMTALPCGQSCKLQPVSCPGRNSSSKQNQGQVSGTSGGHLLSQRCQLPSPSALTAECPESIRWSDRAAVSGFNFQSYFIRKISADRNDYVSKYSAVDFECAVRRAGSLFTLSS